MTDADLIAQCAALPAVYVDALGAYRKINGVLRCVGFTLDGGVQLNLVLSLAGADHAIVELKRAMSGEPERGFQIWHGCDLMH